MDDVQEHLETIRQPWTLVIVYTVFYAAIFIVGLVGNVFVVLAVLLNTNLRSVTDYLISSLALADLLIIVFCLPTTLLNNLLTEWQLGSIGCKLSTFINSTTSCASIFTLVAVTADRYVAICHTLKYALWETRTVVCLIVLIWFVSAVLASPNLILYDEILYDLMPPNGTLVARLCVSIQDDFLHFIIVNLIIAFLLPVVMICVSYARIFITVSNHQSLAVDARIRDERVKLRVAQMMLTVIVVFMMCWTPLYALYFYFFMATNRESTFFHVATSVLRPIFQWLSLLSSSLNPLIYIAYSQKYRRAFHQLLLMPCRVRYQSLRRATRATLRLPPLKADEALTMSATTGDFPPGAPTCNLCFSSWASSPIARCRKVSLPYNGNNIYYYHHPAHSQYSYGSIMQKSRKMSEQTPSPACSAGMGSRGATLCSRHSEALLMCDSSSRRSSRKSLGVLNHSAGDSFLRTAPMTNGMAKSSTNRSLKGTEKKKDSTKKQAIKNGGDRIGWNNEQPHGEIHCAAQIGQNQDRSNKKASTQSCIPLIIGSSAGGICTPTTTIVGSNNNGNALSPTTDGISLLKSPLRFLRNLVFGATKIRSVSNIQPKLSDSSSRRVITVTRRRRENEAKTNGKDDQKGSLKDKSDPSRGMKNELINKKLIEKATLNKLQEKDSLKEVDDEEICLLEDLKKEKVLAVPPPKPARSALMLNNNNRILDQASDIEYADEVEDADEVYQLGTISNRVPPIRLLNNSTIDNDGITKHSNNIATNSISAKNVVESTLEKSFQKGVQQEIHKKNNSTLNASTTSEKNKSVILPSPVVVSI